MSKAGQPNGFWARAVFACRGRLGTWAPDRNKTLEVVLAALIVLNLLDAVLTLFWVMTGATTEENPLMEVALEFHPIAFMGAKMGLVSAAVLMMHRFRSRRTVFYSSLALLAIYYWIAIHHAWFYGSVVVPILFFDAS